MQYLGIDIHKKFSQVTVIGEGEEIIDRRKLDNDRETINQYLNNFDQSSTKAVLEATFSW